MKLKKDLLIKAGSDVVPAPNISRRNGKWHSIAVYIGKGNYAELILNDEALSILNAQQQNTKEIVKGVT